MLAYLKTERKDKPCAQRKESKKEASQPNLTGIPDFTKARLESLSGYSFDDVRVHYNSERPAQLQALAYTRGNQVYIGRGQERCLEHELGHVVQQKQGRVAPTVNVGGVPVNDEEALEREADTFGGVLQRFAARPVSLAGARDVVQRNKSDFSELLAGRNPEVPNVLVYGTEPDRSHLRIEGVSEPTERTKLQAMETSLSALEGTQKDKKIEEIKKGLAEAPNDLPAGYVENAPNQPSGSATKKLFTVDRYNNYAWRDFPYDGDKVKYSIFNPEYAPGAERNLPQVANDLKAWTQTTAPGPESASILDFQRELLAHPRYSPLVTLKESADFSFMKEQKTKGPDGSMLPPAEKEAKNKFELQTRRGCKFGLEYAVKKLSADSDKAGTGKQALAFVIGSAKLEAMRDKKRPNGSKREVPITTSELRKLYRMHSRKGIDAQTYGFYDKQGAKTDAPWAGEEQKKAWEMTEYRNAMLYSALYHHANGKDYEPKLGPGEMLDIWAKDIDNLKELICREMSKTAKKQAQMSPSELIYAAFKKYCVDRGLCTAEENPQRSELKKRILGRIAPQAMVEEPAAAE